MGRKDYVTALSKLTPKQRKYAKNMVKGEHPNSVSAYREAYQPRGSKATTRTDAARVAKVPHVRTAIDEGIRLQEYEEHRSLASRRRWIVDSLAKEAETAPSDAARVRALELLARAAGVFDSPEDRAAERSTANESALLAELQNRLQEAFAGAPVWEDHLGGEEPAAVTTEPLGDIVAVTPHSDAAGGDDPSGDHPGDIEAERIVIPPGD